MKLKIVVIHKKDTLLWERRGFTVIPVDRSTPVGNPYPLYDEKKRDEVCDLYQAHFEACLSSPEPSPFKYYLAQIRALSRKGPIALSCYCAPKRCHADTIRRWLFKPS